ncbi:MAG: type II secretion system GspH family protein [Candidatus Doudnabacteria bacterium]|nr:type II secretion system GspH family protein [Candidatus Doudnabacteria bacterium]
MTKKNTTKRSLGFTMIELLVVISIISLLSSMAVSATRRTRGRARDIQRLENIKALQNVLELYYADNGSYPKTFEPGEDVYPQTVCGGFMTNYIPGVVPKYIAKLPTDPILKCSGVTHGFTYASDGKDYKLITHHEGYYKTEIQWIDPAQDNGQTGPGYCIIDGDGSSPHVGVWTPGALCWPI